MIHAVVSLLAGHLAVGTLAVTAFLSASNPLPEAFVRFCILGAIVSGIVAWLVASGPPATAYLAVVAIGAAWYLWLRHRGAQAAIALLVATASVAALIVGMVSSLNHREPLSVAGAVASSFLLGSVSVSMILGHWYLITPQLSIKPLRQGAVWLAAVLIARWLVLAAILTVHGWEVVRISRFADLFFSTVGLFFLFRVLMGLIAPTLLAGLIWQTVKLRSTQSATGLLYVAVVLVLFGELLSQFLTVSTGHAL